MKRHIYLIFFILMLMLAMLACIDDVVVTPVPTSIPVTVQVQCPNMHSDGECIMVTSTP